MGLTKLTRYELFMNVVGILDQQDYNDIYMFEKVNEIRNMYYNSAIIINDMEDIINESDEILNDITFEEIISNNIRRIDDNSFVEIIRNGIESQVLDKREKNKKIEFKDYFRFLLKILTEYQNKIIDKNFVRMEGISSVRREKKQTFLSYAYTDKGLTLALYYMFMIKGGFLYVNWMWEEANNDSRVTKKALEKALFESEQFLFLRTTNSELHVRGNNNSIRQWCSWEIGFYYTRNKYEKYYTSFYDKRPTRNDLLDTFNVMVDVVNGKVIG